MNLDKEWLRDGHAHGDERRGGGGRRVRNLFRTEGETMSPHWQRFIRSNFFRPLRQYVLRRTYSSLFLKKVFCSIVWDLPDFMRPTSIIRRALRDLSCRQKDVFFLNIGANDGLDHIGEYAIRKKWRGIMVEPVPYIFKSLQKVYKRIPWVKLENVAIADAVGMQCFYFLKKTNYIPSGDTIGSFDQNHVKHILGNLGVVEKERNLDPFLVSKEVSCLRLSDLMDRNNVTHVDVISIDTEGYDGKIVKQIDLSRYHPELIIYESEHLTAEEQAQCCKFLLGHGYEVYDDSENTLARRVVTNLRPD